MTCGLTPYTYARQSRVKYDIARYQLAQFRGAVPAVHPADLFFRWDGSRELPRVLAHSDGCVVQLYAAFDAFACSVAHQLHLGEEDHAHFTRLPTQTIASTSPQLSDSISAVRKAAQFQKLQEMRHLVAHRGLLIGSVRSDSSMELGITVYLETKAASKGAGTDVLPLLTETVGWARQRLRWLWEFAEAWLETGEFSIKGTVGDLDSSGSL